MTIRELLPSFPELTENEISAPDAIRSLLISKAAKDAPVLVIAPNSRIADLLKSEISSISEFPISEFPAWETLPHERLSPKGDTVTKRIKVLTEVLESSPRIVITSIRGLLQPISKSVVSTGSINLKVGVEITMPDLISGLVHFGFTRSDLVERRGDFAVRGGIIDRKSTRLNSSHT